MGNQGEVIVAWSDTRFGMRDVYAQKLSLANPASPHLWSDASGSNPIDGLLVSGADKRQEDPALCSDGNGGAFISYVDYGQDPAGDLYINYIIDGEGGGALAWQHPVVLCTECVGYSFDPEYYVGIDHQVCPDQNGGAWIAWSDYRNSSLDVFISHVDADGHVDPLFGDNGLAICTLQGNQQSISMDQDGDGGVFLAWTDRRVQADQNIYIEHVYADGSLASGSDGQCVTNRVGFQSSVRACWDGIDGCFVAFREYADDNAGDILVQHFDSELNASFAENGTPVSNGQNITEQNPQLTTAGAGSALLTWEDARNDPNNVESDLYCQKLSVDNASVWESGGVPVTQAEDFQVEARAVVNDAGIAFLTWQDFRASNAVSIYAQSLDENGQTLWPTDGIPVVSLAPAEAQSVYPTLRLDQEGGVFVSWLEAIPGYAAEIRTQHLNASGELSFGNTGDTTVKGIGGNANEVKNLAIDEGCLVFWTDPALGNGPHVFMQHLTQAEGECLLEPNGVPLEPTLDGGQYAYDLLADDNGGAYVLLEVGNYCAQRSYLTHIDGQGNRLWDAAQPVTQDFDEESGLAYQTNAKVIRSGDRLIVAWSGVDTEFSLFYPDVNMQCFDLNGNRCWDQNGIRITSTDEEVERLEALIADGAGGAWVIWRGGIWTAYSLRMQHVDRNGASLLEDGGRILINAEDRQTDAQVVSHSAGGFIVLWSDYPGTGSEADLIAMAVDADGETLWTTSVVTEGNSYRPAALLADRHDGAFVVFTSISPNGDYDIGMRHLLADGTLEWEDQNGDVFVGAGNQQGVSATVIPRGNWNGLLIVAEMEELDSQYGYRDLWAREYHVSPTGGTPQENPVHPWQADAIAEIDFSQRAPYVSYNQADGAYVSWIDMRASGKEEHKDVYTCNIDFSTTSLDPETGQPQVFKLAQNFPNPFNPVTQIEFQLLQPERVRLEVYNLTGQLVEVLLDEERASGSHSLPFDGSKLASGIYLYSLESAGQRQTRRMVLLK